MCRRIAAVDIPGRRGCHRGGYSGERMVIAGAWRQRRWLGAWAGLALMLADLAGAALVRIPTGEAAQVLAASQVICTLAGMRRTGVPAGSPQDHSYCPFCLPLAHAAGAPASGPPLPLPLALAGERLAAASGPALDPQPRRVLPPARAPPQPRDRYALT